MRKALLRYALLRHRLLGDRILIAVWVRLLRGCVVWIADLRLMVGLILVRKTVFVLLEVCGLKILSLRHLRKVSLFLVEVGIIVVTWRLLDKLFVLLILRQSSIVFLIVRIEVLLLLCVWVEVCSL